MGDLKLNGATSGTITVTPTAVAGTNTITLPASTGTVALTASPTFSGTTTVATLTATTITSPSATALTIQSAGTTAMTIDTSQNVGIGTTSPAGYGSGLTTIDVEGANGAGIKFGLTSARYGVYCNSTGGYLQTFGAYPILFATNNAEAMRIDTSGNLLVGTTSANGKVTSKTTTTSLPAFFANTPSGFITAAYQSESITAASTGWYHFYGTSSTGTVANIAIFGNGNVQNANNSYGALSDVSLKENINDAAPKLDDLLKVQVRNYNLKNDPDKTKQIGVVAQELELIFPAMVETDSDGIKGVKYSVFVPMLIKALQELSAKNDALEARLAALEAK
jgi:hypothetical protein